MNRSNVVLAAAIIIGVIATAVYFWPQPPSMPVATAEGGDGRESSSQVAPDEQAVPVTPTARPGRAGRPGSIEGEGSDASDRREELAAYRVSEARQREALGDLIAAFDANLADRESREAIADEIRGELAAYDAAALPLALEAMRQQRQNERLREAP
jgi:hypothetical protein